MKSILSLLLCLFCAFVLHAQHNLSGVVLTPDNTPIEFASISLYPIADSSNLTGGITAQNGAFQLSNLPTETYQITVQMLGYEDWTKQVTLSKSLNLGQIVLTEETLLLSEIEVVAQQSTVESHLGKKVLRIGQDLSTNGSNALEALEIIPSINTTPQGKIQIRGNSNVVIYINGKETKRDPATLKFISAETLEKIEVVTNPSAKYDAEGVGGIINLVYKKDKINNFKLETIANLGILTNPFYLSPNLGVNASLNREKVSFFTNVSWDFGKYEDYNDSK